jgi:acetyl esterase/lipase/lysophospholipase L1-like esterase
VLVLAVLLAVAAGAAAQPGKSNLPEGTKVHRNMEYVKDGHERNKLDLYLPEKADGLLPVIVWVHGGAWMGGNKDGGPALPFIGKRYAVACINYRLSQHAVFPAQIEDCKAAIRWLRANAKTYQLDPEHIGVWGASAGGHLVALLGTTGSVKELEGKGGNAEQSSLVQAVVDFFGPTDFLQMDAHAVPGARLKHDPPTSPESRLIGGAIQENVEKVGRANPIKYVTKDAPPFLIVHGEQDPLVPCHQSELLYEALKKVRGNVAFYKIAGAGHGGAEFNTDMMRAAVQAFFDKHLKPRPDDRAKTPLQPEGGKDKQKGSDPASDQPVPRRDANSKLAHQQMVENLKKGRIDVYFVGDSITRRWRATDYPQFLTNWNKNFFGWNAANFGWGGDTIQNILWRLRNGELEGVQPKIIVLLAGTNNVGNTRASDAKVADITKGVKALLDTMREKVPKATIIVMGILPRNDGAEPTAVMPSINKINENIAKFADGKTIRYLNISDKLADKDGKLFEGMAADRLHLSLKGYQVWADALKPLLTELLGPPAKEDDAPPPTGDPSAAKKKAPARTPDRQEMYDNEDGAPMPSASGVYFFWRLVSSFFTP